MRKKQHAVFFQFRRLFCHDYSSQCISLIGQSSRDQFDQGLRFHPFNLSYSPNIFNPLPFEDLYFTYMYMYAIGFCKALLCYG